MNLWEKVTKIANGAQIIRDWLGSGGIAVDRTLAQSRADVCLTCPCNQSGSGLTDAVANAIKEHVQLKNTMGMRVKGEKSLQQCSICLCSIRLKIWCPSEHIAAHTSQEELAKFPEVCWIGKEIRQTV